MLTSNVKQTSSEENLGKQGFHYDTEQLFERIASTVIKKAKS